MNVRKWKLSKEIIEKSGQEERIFLDLPQLQQKQTNYASKVCSLKYVSVIEIFVRQSMIFSENTSRIIEKAKQMQSIQHSRRSGESRRRRHVSRNSRQ